MGKIIRLNSQIKPKTVDNLLDEGAEVHTYIHRLIAEARVTYGIKCDTFEYVRHMLAGLESYITNSTKYLEWVDGQQEELSILGNLPIEIMEERYEKIGQRIAAYRAIHPKVVIAKRIS